MAYALPSDVAQELRGSTSVTESEEIQWTAWIDRAERQIGRFFRLRGLVLDAQVGLGAPTAEEVADAVVVAVVRKVQNPTWGVTSTTRSVDDWSRTERREGGDGRTDPLVLSEEELETLIPSEAPSIEAYSTRPSFQADTPSFGGW